MRIIMTLTFLAAMCFGCASAEIGDSCDTAGNTDQCVDGAICSPVAGVNACRKICTESSACASTEGCLGVSGSSLKSCQPKPVK